ncbi:MAG: hypothetical protein Q9190_004769 [Brigantiaea leucoxantha]
MTGYAERNISAGHFTLPAYNIQTESWETVSVSGEPHTPYPPTELEPLASSYDGGESLSFLSNGSFGSNSSDNDGNNGMAIVVFDSSDPSSLSRNVYSNLMMPYLYLSTTQFLRFGTAGILVTVGGFFRSPSTNYSISNAAEFQVLGLNTTDLRDMTKIQIYNIAAKEWFEVNATGDIPQPRHSLCSAISAAPDDSSFQMIIYGGSAAENVFADVYILTMPAFHWIKIPATVTDYDPTNPNLSSNSTGAGRMRHFCGTYKDRQMFVLGGTDKNLNMPLGCTGDQPSLRVLDTTTFHWQTRFPINKSYQVPQAVFDVVGGGPNGGARQASSWRETLGDKMVLFNKTIPKYEPPIIKRDTDQPNGNSTVSPQPTSPPVSTNPPISTGKPKKGVIAGAAVGAVTGTLLIGATAFFIKNRRRRARREEKDEQEDWHKPELENSAKQMAEIDGSERVHEELDGRPVRVEVPGAEHACEAPAAEHSCEMSG